MEKVHIGHYGARTALVVVMNVVIAWGQLNNAAATDGPLREEMAAGINDMSAGHSRSVRSEDQSAGDISERRPSVRGVMVAEDMRCRQCRGKCRADDLRCRSQCVSETTCLAQCEERSSKCETMCKQIFQCE